MSSDFCGAVASIRSAGVPTAIGNQTDGRDSRPTSGTAAAPPEVLVRSRLRLGERVASTIYFTKGDDAPAQNFSCSNPGITSNSKLLSLLGTFTFSKMTTVREIEKAIGNLPLAGRLEIYRDLPDLIGRTSEDLDWQRAALDVFFADDSDEDAIYDAL